MGKDSCSTSFSYAAKLAEAVLLGVVATRFPDKTLHFNRKDLNFTEAEANQFLDTEYRSF